MSPSMAAARLVRAPKNEESRRVFGARLVTNLNDLQSYYLLLMERS